MRVPVPGKSPGQGGLHLGAMTCALLYVTPGLDAEDNRVDAGTCLLSWNETKSRASQAPLLGSGQKVLGAGS